MADELLTAWVLVDDAPQTDAVVRGCLHALVDKFLAIPYYEQCFNQKVHVIDGMAYEQEVERYLNAFFYRLTKGTKYLRYNKFEFAVVLEMDIAIIEFWSLFHCLIFLLGRRKCPVFQDRRLRCST